jgi:hypothetical protein
MEPFYIPWACVDLNPKQPESEKKNHPKHTIPENNQYKPKNRVRETHECVDLTEISHN